MARDRWTNRGSDPCVDRKPSSRATAFSETVRGTTLPAPCRIWTKTSAWKGCSTDGRPGNRKRRSSVGFRIASAPADVSGGGYSTRLESGRYIDVGRGCVRCGNRSAVLTQAVEMKRDRRSHLALGLFARRTGRYAPVEIRRVSRVTRVGLFDDDQVSHFFVNPACSNIRQPAFSILFTASRTFIERTLALDKPSAWP